MLSRVWSLPDCDCEATAVVSFCASMLSIWFAFSDMMLILLSEGPEAAHEVKLKAGASPAQGLSEFDMVHHAHGWLFLWPLVRLSVEAHFAYAGEPGLSDGNQGRMS